jgi:hypothetical protein
VLHFVMTMMMVVIGFTSSSELRRYDRSRGRSSRSRKEKKDDSNQPEKFDIVHVNDIYGSLDFVPGTLYSTIHHTRGRAHTHTHTHTGEDLFGHVDRILSEKEKAEKRVKEATRRRETLWKQFQGTLPEHEREGPNSRPMFDLGQGRDPSRANLDPFPSEEEDHPPSLPSQDWSSLPADNPFDLTPSYSTKSFGPRLKFGNNAIKEETTSPWAGEMTKNPVFRGGRDVKSNPLTFAAPVHDKYHGSAYEGVRMGVRAHDPRNTKLLTPSWWERRGAKS